MKIAVASGKGGTGKTTVAVALAETLGARAVLLDCDVEEPNCHLFLQSHIESSSAVTVMVPRFHQEQCTGCGRCAKVCRFNAIASLGKRQLIFQELCHSCGNCLLSCPADALTESTMEIGRIHRRTPGAFPLYSGELQVGHALSVPLIRQLKEMCEDDKINILDAPPGTACPMVNSVRGCDYVILVTEPTPFGLHDLAGAVETLRTMEIPCGIIINRDEGKGTLIEDYAGQNKLDILMRIPFSRKIAEGYSAACSLLQSAPELKEKFSSLLEKVEAL